jgi:hypothetical protein
LIIPAIFLRRKDMSWSELEEMAYQDGYRKGIEEMEYKIKKAEEVGFHKGFLEGTKHAIKMIADYEATLLRPIIIERPKEAV